MSSILVRDFRAERDMEDFRDSPGRGILGQLAQLHNRATRESADRRWRRDGDSPRETKRLKFEVDAPLFFPTRRLGRRRASSCLAFMPNESVSQWPRPPQGERACVCVRRTCGDACIRACFLFFVFFPSPLRRETDSSGRIYVRDDNGT